jgi:hypothetical protein
MGILLDSIKPSMLFNMFVVHQAPSAGASTPAAPGVRALAWRDFLEIW